MSTAQRMSMCNTIMALDDLQCEFLWKMLQGLTDEVIEIEELSPEETAEYEEGFEEMRQGNYITLEDFYEKYGK